LKRARSEWIVQLSPASHFHALFDHIPGVFFFAKDREGRTMLASRGILELYQMRSENEMLGLTDYELNPAAMAAGYVRDDQRLLAGKVRTIERLELWFDTQGLPDWFVVTKLPLRNLRGRRIGVMGVLRRTADHEKRLPVFQTVSRAVEIIRRDYASPLTIAALAKSCAVSPRQLQRRFQSAFGISPQEFVLKTRVLVAAQMLEETSLSAAEIGERCGFTDPSAFTEQFHRRIGMTPVRYRKNGAVP
jgi:AraC-like DNA-binding protein